MRSFILTCTLLASTSAYAQTVPDTVLLEFFDAQNPTGAISNFSVPFTSFLCDQAPVPLPTGAIRNPLRVSFDDPSRPGRACIWASNTAPATGQGPIFALPVRQAGYIAKATFIAVGVQGDPSEPSNPFLRTPGRPTTLRVGG